MHLHLYTLNCTLHMRVMFANPICPARPAVRLCALCLPELRAPRRCTKHPIVLQAYDEDGFRTYKALLYCARSLDRRVRQREDLKISKARVKYSRP